MLGLEILGAHGLAAQVIRPAVGQVDVIAVRVEFLADTTELTSGTGVFGPDGFGGLDYLAREQDTALILCPITNRILRPISNLHVIITSKPPMGS